MTIELILDIANYTEPDPLPGDPLAHRARWRERVMAILSAMLPAGEVVATGWMLRKLYLARQI